ncbi:sulfurtransferase [Corynebacterium yudongzhengii]|uniref:Rhodanese-like domain-containing protein n=1 Tax=Corynebacterium yudongzhengii TaxID=2080740 RepID=A0A2U1T5Z1_9CORY|nr:rhodanese-like domain-containing protein [Corynebacterium yudongzhengii]AWB82651.1 sulfurtransferase [Corynebacterium yudongzhengii]PWC01383.1 rhodanese-like domain-containing protein [Corynebacterium yudongzhengii]
MKQVNVTEVPVSSQFIDVREPDEYAEAHAVGTVNIPMSELAQRTEEINPAEPVYLICRSGGRSARMAEFLEETFPDVEAINVTGGTLAWIEAELPTEK